jgi:hypothetical protein
VSSLPGLGVIFIDWKSALNWLPGRNRGWVVPEDSLLVPVCPLLLALNHFHWSWVPLGAKNTLSFWVFLSVLDNLRERDPFSPDNINTLQALLCSKSCPGYRIFRHCECVCCTGEAEHLEGTWLLPRIALGDSWPGHLEIGNNHNSRRHILSSPLSYSWNPLVTHHWVQPPGRTRVREGPSICWCLQICKRPCPNHGTLHTSYTYPESWAHFLTGK